MPSAKLHKKNGAGGIFGSFLYLCVIMKKMDFAGVIASELGLGRRGVENVIALLGEGCTIPFISRYRKERTGGLDEVAIAAVSDMNERLVELAKRKDTVVATIEGLGKMTPELRERIDACVDAAELEDIYLPYRPKRRTRAQIARENGLEPLASVIMGQRCGDVGRKARAYLGDKVPDVRAAVDGAKDIIAETVSEDEGARNILRAAFRRGAIVRSSVVRAKAADEQAAKYADYFDFSEPLRRCSSHRYLAMRRGADEGFLRVSIVPGDDTALERIRRRFVHSTGECGAIVGEAVEDAWKRLLCPSIENEIAAEKKAAADDEAIAVFGNNLRQLLLGAPLGRKRVMAVDPGFRTGCKVVCLDSQGALLHYEAIYPHTGGERAQGAARRVRELVGKFAIEAIAIGDGTAGRETERFIRGLDLGDGVRIFTVSEDGASVYSASKTARDEFPDHDVTVRGAVSIGRRLMDPLAELVKIDPKSIGVGQYQHDVDQGKLKRRLDLTVESCVNLVGVNVNTAGVHLLTYVSGLGPALAKNIVDYRAANGPFASRSQLLGVPRLGPAAYRQCAGFLRVDGSENPLDNTGVHPESYHIVERMARDSRCSVAELISDASKRRAIRLEAYVGGDTGMPTLEDIMAELEKPGRDPRERLEEFSFAEGIDSIEKLVAGMELPGIVTNITNFGVFVDVGVHHDGLVHISQLSDRYVSDPMQVVALRQRVVVRVLDVDLRRGRISLTMRK